MFGSKSCIVLIALIVTAGCATTSGQRTLLPPAGTQIEVTQELSIGGGARLFMQRGQVRSQRDISVMDPHCQFISTRPRSEFGEALVIRPGIFTVENSFRRRDYTWAAELEFAQIGSSRNLSSIMELSSDTQQDIDRLTCLRWGTGGGDGFLTIEEMQTAMGELVTINMPE